MGDAVTNSLTFAVGIAASPIPIVVVVVMFLSARPRLNSVVFVTTWIVGIATIVTVASLVPGLGSDAESGGTGRGIVRTILGAVFLGLAVRNWRRRTVSGEEPSTPPWLNPDGGIGVRAAVGLGVLLSLLNPKDLTLAVAGGAAIGAEELQPGQQVPAIVVFTLVAVSTVALPLIVYLVVGTRTVDAFDRMKEWLLRHNATVLAVIWLVLGIAFVLEGIAAIIR
jgi:threonine/homoserine/homoserine lactone efflux protein